MGQTSQRLQDKINQHIPRCIRSDKRTTKNLPNRECKITNTPSVCCDSAIGQHLLENKECAKHFNDAQFSILATARSSFHLSVLEATYINALQPIPTMGKLRLASRMRLSVVNFVTLVLNRNITQKIKIILYKYVISCLKLFSFIDKIYSISIIYSILER